MHNLQQKLTEQLRTAGLQPQDTVIVHSSLKRIGVVPGGGDDILQALTDYFAPGLLVFPTLTYTLFHDFDATSEECQLCLRTHPAGYCLARQWPNHRPEFHANSTPSCIGVLPNLFLQLDGVCRSLNPSHSVAALGREAATFVSGHELCHTPCGKNTPWWKLYERNAKILHLGSPLTSTTFMHGVCEWLLKPGEITPLIPNQVTVYDSQEQVVAMAPQHITAGGAHTLPRFSEQLEAKGILVHFTFGEAPSAILECGPLADFFFARGTVEP